MRRDRERGERAVSTYGNTSVTLADRTSLAFGREPPLDAAVVCAIHGWDHCEPQWIIARAVLAPQLRRHLRTSAWRRNLIRMKPAPFQPTRPDPNQDDPVAPEVERILRDRLETFDEDAKAARPWEDVLADLKARKPLPPSPR